jgi:gamma-glutamyl-gamma-aminobutyrate hydrolase PuuD
MNSRGASQDAPIVGLTTYQEPARFGVWDTEAALLPRSYVDAVSRAGGTPVLLPPQAATTEVVLPALDALVLTGGADVDPARYGQSPGRHTGTPRRDRDTGEFVLLDAALAAELPVFGVCRGMQVLNVALGGTLTQHLPDAVGHTEHQPAPGVFGDTRVALAAGSRAAAILGPTSTVRCYHHQALAEVAADLVVSGRAEDGTVEAVERPGPGFVLGVQWHPETDPDDDRLFRALVDAARNHRSRRRDV